MKKVLLFLFCTLEFTFLHASSEGCETNFNIAESIMRHRQDGDSIISQYEVLDYIKGQTKGAKKYSQATLTYEKMIIMAYEIPKYSLAEYQDRAVADFAEHWFLRCKSAEKQH